MAEAARDQNRIPTLMAVSSVDGTTPVPLYADPTTHRLYVDLPGGSGTVTSVSVVSANGFAGTVANATTTPAITLSTTITGVLKGNGTAISAASAGTDYTTPTGTENLQNKTLDNTNTITVKDTLFTLQDNADTTKQAVFELTNITTGTTRTYTFPNSSATLAILSGTQTFSGQTTFSNATVTVGTATTTATYGLGTGVMATGNTKTINIGTSGASGSTTAITIGSSTGGATNTVASYGTWTHTGDLALGSGNLTLTGSIASTGSRVTKGWFTDIESTNMPTVGGTAILTSLTAPQFTTIELGNASDTTLARSAAGVMTVEGARVITSSGTTSNTILKNNGTTFVASTETYAAPGTSGNVMTSDGTNWISAAPTGGTTTASTHIATIFETSARFTTTLSSGTATWGTDGLVIAGAASASARATVQLLPTNASNFKCFDDSPTVRFVINILSLGTAGRNFVCYLGTGDSLANASDDGRRKIAFKIHYSSSVATLYGCHDNASSETLTSALTTLSANDVVELAFKVNGTSSTDFYYKVNSGSWSSATNLASGMPSDAGTRAILTMSIGDLSGLGTTPQIAIESASYDR